MEGHEQASSRWLLCFCTTGRLLREAVQGLQVVFPQLRIIVKDRAHGTRRLTKRGWDAIVFLGALLKVLIFDKHSLVRLIQYSGPFADWFQQEIRAQEAKPINTARMRNLNFAKQRFESTQRPIERAVLYFEARIATALRILNNRGRSSAEGQQSEICLRYINNEVALQLTMVADGGAKV